MPTIRELLPKTVLLWLTLLGAFVLAALVGRWQREAIEAVDVVVLTWMREHWSPAWGRAASTFTILGTAEGYLPMGAIVLALLWSKSRHDALSVTTLLAGAAAFYLVLNRVIFSRERPHLFGDEPDFQGSSLPSGHALLTLTLTVGAAVAVQRHWPGWSKPLWALGAVFCLAIGFSRLYLQAHYPSDVIAGWALAALWCWGFYVIERRHGRVPRLGGAEPSAGAQLTAE